MSPHAAAYSFLPWVRSGLANRITAGDADTTVQLRASVRVQLELRGTARAGGAAPAPVPVNRDVELFGPGDVVALDRAAVVRTEPRDGITNFEPNYLAFVEFYDEDLPWRYTPAGPDGVRQRLRPWLMLAVLEEGEFEDGGAREGVPSSFIRVTDQTKLPPAAELAAWAHVHVNRSLIANPALVQSSDATALATQLQNVLRENPDLACSRIISPRRLRENAVYHAFLVPAYESGRLAGLNLDPAEAPYATASAWEPYPSGGPAKREPESLPYYYRWYFRTGGPGDFEELVRLLRPRSADSRVGRRDIDVQVPGSGLPGIDGALGGILKLGGALRVPDPLLSQEERDRRDQEEAWYEPAPHAFQRALATLINLADDYLRRSASSANTASGLDPEVAGAADPVITPPLYGRWHSLTRRLLRRADGTPVDPDDNWVHELNLDPRHRVTAGFGTRVVQTNQEQYMDAAWQQVGDVLEANRRIRLGQLAREASRVWHQAHLAPLLARSPVLALVMTAPVQRKVMDGTVTVLHRVRESPLSAAAFSAPLRRMTRPGGALMRGLGLAPATGQAEVLERLNAGDIFAAPPKRVPEGVATVEQLADLLVDPEGLSPALAGLLRRFPWLPVAVLVAGGATAVVIVGLSGGRLIVVAVFVVAGSVALYRWLRALQRRLAATRTLREDGRTPAAVDALAKSPNFRIAKPGEGPAPTIGATDSPEAVRYKAALRDAHRMFEAAAEAGREPARRPLDVEHIATTVLSALDPVRTVPARVRATIRVPPRILDEIGESFDEIWAYPVIDLPMYRPLVDLSSELFLPNLGLVPENSVTLLESNQAFIEAYMVGLNHEGVRELQWREFPTDLRGTMFRQFWEPSGYRPAGTPDPEEVRERLRDIPPLHEWPRRSALGTHDNRVQGGVEREEVVLVIRGELLKRYPTAVIYAQLADWQRTGGRIDPEKPRLPVRLSGAEAADPPRDKIKTPLYEAKVEPDIYFLGFDLTADEARGGDGDRESDPPGWFFVIEERPGEPRFGLDVARPGALNVWNDLAWNDVMPSGGGTFIPIGATTPARTLVAPTDAAKQAQYDEDRLLASWTADVSSADVAYVLYQAPVRVAIHAAEMLKRNE